VNGPQRGDLLLIYQEQQKESYRVGDVVALRVGDRQATIVHRIVQLSTSGENEQESVGQASRRKYQSVQILTKGDDNRVNDRGLYPPGESWLPVDSILGKVIGIVRFGGMFSILLEEHFWFRAVLLARAFQFGWRRMGNRGRVAALWWQVVVFNATVLANSGSRAFS